MKKMIAYTLIMTMVLTISAFNFSYAAKEDELSKVNNQLSNAQKELNAGKKLQSSLNKEINSLESQINSAQKEIASLKGNIDAINGKINEAFEELDRIEKSLHKQNEDMSVRLRAMYKRGNVGMLDVILGSTGISDLMKNMERVQIIYDNDKATLQQMEAQKKMIDEQRKYLVGLQGKLEAEKQAEAEKQGQLVGVQDQVEAKKSEVEKDNKALQEQVAALYAEANRLVSEIQSLQGGGDYIGGGKMGWPVSGKTTSEFGTRTHPITGKKETHTGLDIAVPKGTPVKAANDGTVIKAAWNNSYGNMVMIDHGGTIVTLYAHNSSLSVSNGDKVVRGQTIALAGSTGMSTGPHCHFEVRVNGKYQNPRSWL